MTKQEVYDKVKAHLLAQGKQSWDEERDLCMYRGPGGLKCAVGVLIPDEKYVPQMEGEVSDTGWLEKYGLTELLPFEELLQDLQTVHDLGLTSMWESHLRDVAQRHGLAP